MGKQNCLNMIKNRAEIETSKERKLVLDLIERGIRSVLPSAIMGACVRFDRATNTIRIVDLSFDLGKGRLFVIGAGKASGLMAQTLEEIVDPDRIAAGFVNCKDEAYGTRKIKIAKAGHPVPDEAGIAGTLAMLNLKQAYSIDERDLVLCLISGGGSALLPCPAEGITLAEKQETTKFLVSSGADIHEINTVRKHLSRTKGGGLGRHFAPARVMSLILSDVIGDNLDVIASGPTVADSSTFADAKRVLERYKLLERVAPAIRERIEAGCFGGINENPTTLDNCSNYLIGNNRIALEAMKKKAESLGLRARIITAKQVGEPSAAARKRVEEIRSGQYAGNSVLLAGGETTPVLPAKPGCGGRNQHFAAEVLQSMQGFDRPWVCASVGTDGSDFLPDVAGAIVDSSTLKAAEERNLSLPDFLARFDSNTFLHRAGNSLIMTGPTGTNVCDLVVFLTECE